MTASGRMTQRALVALYSALTDCAKGGCQHCQQLQSYAQGMIDKADLHPSAPMELYCPECGNRHIDRGVWATPERPHRTHACETCGNEWRPFPYATVGT